MLKSKKFYLRSRNIKFATAIFTLVVSLALWGASIGLFVPYFQTRSEANAAEQSAIANNTYAEFMESGEHLQWVRKQAKQEAQGIAFGAAGLAASMAAVGLLKSSSKDDDKADEASEL